MQVNFSYAAPPYLDCYNKTFNQTCYFERAETKIIFPVEWLSLPLVTGKKNNTTLINGFLGNGVKETADVISSVKRLLLCRINRQIPSLDEAAEELFLSTAQLRRRLYSRKTSYKKVVLDVRMTLALHYMEGNNFNVEEISTLLGYSEASAFSRSFKNYFKISPQLWRNQTTRHAK